MTALLHNLKQQRLASRPDSEHGQALVRLAITVAGAGLPAGWRCRATLDAATAYADRPDDGAGRAASSALGLLVGDRAAAGRVARAPLDRHGRRLRPDGRGHDRSMGEPLRRLYVILMWVTIGNGLRYGSRYLRVATALATRVVPRRDR